MRRPGNESFYRDFVWKIRNTIDNVVIRSTFIVGHPMEEEEDFNQLLRFLEDVKIERAGFFKYYREKGTLSYSLPQVDYKIKNRRYKTISSLQDKVLKYWSEKQIGKVFKVLLESEEDNYYIGRAYFDAPEVDSTIKILKNKTLKNKGRKSLLGNFCNVKIVSFEEYDFYGECVS
jgi:ribosomal protein S12 methylthiotransferase